MPAAAHSDTEGHVFLNVLIAIDDAGRGEDARVLGAALAGESASVATVHVTRHGEPRPGGVDLVVEGPFDTALARLVGERGADLVVVGAHHRELVWSANHLRAALHAVRCSVAVAPDGYGRQGAAHAISTIGIAYDEGPESTAALDAGRALAGSTGARLEVIEVVRDSNLVETTSTAGWRAEAAERRLAGIEGATVVVLEGEPLTRLREAARGLDLMIVGEHHPDLLGRVIGRTGERLAGGLACPLLLYRPPAGL